MTIPFRPVPPEASRSAARKEAEMVRHPKTLIEFMQMYPTAEDCRQAIFEHRWPPDLRRPRRSGSPGTGRATIHASPHAAILCGPGERPGR